MKGGRKEGNYGYLAKLCHNKKPGVRWTQGTVGDHSITQYVKAIINH